jgi:hypothetical protein
MQRAAIVPAVVLGFCGSVSAAPLGTISGTGTFSGPSNWSFSGAFDFDNSVDYIFGTGLQQFNASSAVLTAMDGNGPTPANSFGGIGNPTHTMGPAAWEILNTWGANSTFYGPSFNWAMGSGNSITGTLVTDGSIHWYYGYDETPGTPTSPPGKTALADWQLSPELSFVGSYQVGQNNDFTFNGAVSLAPVPEPETYGMMMAGLGLIGFIARRRKLNA